MSTARRRRVTRALRMGLVFGLAVGVGGDRVRGFSWFQAGGVDVVWSGGLSVRYLSPTTFPPGSVTLTHYLAAMGLWNIVPATNFEYQYALLDQDYPIDHFDGYNDTAAVAAGTLDPGVLAVTYMVNNGATWYDMDMLFSDYPLSVGWNFDPNPPCDVIAAPTPSSGFSFLLVATHELGHALGLGHDPLGTEPAGTPWFIATMNPRYPSGGPVGQENIVELHTDDRNGLRYLYPHSGPAAPPMTDLATAEFTSGGVIGKAVPISFAPSIVFPGQTLTARSVIENFGTTNQFGVRQGYYLSSDGVIDAADLFLGELLWDMAFGDAFEFDVEMDLPADLAAGQYFLGSIIDHPDAIAEEYEDNNAAVYCSTLTIGRLPPVIENLNQELATCGASYTGPTPILTHPLNMNPVTWSIDNPEPGMTINPMTGVISWPNPVRSEFLYTIYLRATNSAGSATQVLFLGVTGLAPQIAPIAPQTAACAVAYAGPAPQITQPACMSPIINWSLDAGPPGMQIDFDTGVVHWPAPTLAGSPYPVTIRATNALGNGTRTWLLFVAATSDRDGDGDVDLGDFGVFAGCLDGPGQLATAGCECADLDGDDDVDLVDLAAFVRAFQPAP